MVQVLGGDRSLSSSGLDLRVLYVLIHVKRVPIWLVFVHICPFHRFLELFVQEAFPILHRRHFLSKKAVADLFLLTEFALQIFK